MKNIAVKKNTTHSQFKMLCAKLGISMVNGLEEALLDYLSKHDDSNTQK